MAINGNLALAWLEEDDPSRGFFRVRPTAVISCAAGAYVHGGEYGEEGFLRIVPDKNEMSTFKLRMRTLGRLCLIDLRAHPRENDKIRQNKNYALGTDKNPFMIYSDVIRGIPDGLVSELRAQSDSGEPITAKVYLREGDAVTGPYRWSGDGLEACEGAESGVDISAYSILELDDGLGGRATLMVRHVDDVEALQLSPISEFVPEREGKRQSPPSARPADAELHAEPHDEPGAPPHAEPERASHEGELPIALKRLKEQMGLNPRRGRSLSEVVDEQWRMRRQEELGQCVPPLAGSEPVASPAERALAAMDAAWEFEGARAPLIQGIISKDELVRRLLEVCPPQQGALPTDVRLIELEEERLKLITEIDGLKRHSREMKAEVLRELHRTGEIQADELRNSIVLLEEQIEERRLKIGELEQSLSELKEGARRALDRPLTERLTEMVIQDRLRELLGLELAVNAPAEAEDISGAAHAGEDDAPEAVLTELSSPDELIDRASMGLRAAGWQFARDDVVHMLLALALGRPLILSGFAGCDDERFAGALSDALGMERLRDCVRLNAEGDCAAVPPQGSAVCSIWDYPAGAPVGSALLDAGFVMRDDSLCCLPQRMDALPPLADESLSVMVGDAHISERAAGRLNALVRRLGEFGARVSHGALNDCARYVASAAKLMSGGEDQALDQAFASRVLPSLLVPAADELIQALPVIFKGMEKCMKIMRAPLPIY